ncbi:MAG: cobalt ECF transporter S component CbiM [Methanobacteriaceae archaeon]|nr:cobalt ECF transporter S component CbiM [Candidatus Methanorudis spinitermitis]
MHIMEGFLPGIWAIIWYIVSIPVVIYGIIRIKKLAEEVPDSTSLLAVSGAFMFILSSLKIPSVTGSCSHPTGNGIGAAIFGPAVVSVLATITLVFQALLLAHGGITTLGANIFSMGIVGPFAAWGIYKILNNRGISPSITIFFAAVFGNLFTYITTSFQLAMAFPEPTFQSALILFLEIFALTQIPLAIAEGFLAIVIWDQLMKYQPKLLEKLNVLKVKISSNKEIAGDS